MGHTTERYKGDGTLQGRTLYRDTLSSADAVTDMATPLSSGSLLRGLVGRPTLAVAVEFNTASETATVAVLIYDKRADAYVMLGMQKATATADATARRSATGRFLSAPLLFDTLGGSHYEVRLFTAAAHAVDLRTWEY